MGSKRTSYTDEDKAAALAMLDANGGNVKGTADSLGIPESTLRSWKNERGTPSNIAKLREVKKGELAERLEDFANILLDVAPDKLDAASTRDVVTALGIVVDKLQLLQGKPTERSQIDATVKHDIDSAREDILSKLSRIAGTSDA